jgi:hypothetical protein
MGWRPARPKLVHTHSSIPFLPPNIAVDTAHRVALQAHRVI